jgi:N utilization substance protein B
MSDAVQSAPWRSKEAHARGAARLAAVQALYQMDLAQTDLNEVIAQFEAHRFAAPAERGEAGGERGEPEDCRLADVDIAFFGALLKGVVRWQREIDPLLDQQLAQGWRLTRIDSILRAILRGGAFELIERTDIPARVIISEYVEVARAFFEVDEPKVVNGVLDKLARKLRPGELEAERRE